MDEAPSLLMRDNDDYREPPTAGCPQRRTSLADYGGNVAEFTYRVFRTDAKLRNTLIGRDPCWNVEDRWRWELWYIDGELPAPLLFVGQYSMERGPVRFGTAFTERGAHQSAKQAAMMLADQYLIVPKFVRLPRP